MGATGHLKSVSSWAMGVLLDHPFLVEFFVVSEPTFRMGPGLLEDVARVRRIDSGVLHSVELHVPRLLREWRSPSLDLDKAWGGLHSLVGSVSAGRKSHLRGVVRGGKPFGSDLGYGKARYLTPRQVSAAAAALDRIPAASLPERLRGKWRWWRDEDRSFWLSCYRSLATYYRRAALRGHAMLLYLMQVIEEQAAPSNNQMQRTGRGFGVSCFGKVGRIAETPRR